MFVCGPSGCGKSSLLGLLGGVHLPQQGSIRLLGRDLVTLGRQQRDRLRGDHIGFIFQQFNLIPYLSVEDNVLLPCRFSARRAERARQLDADPLRSAHRLLDSLGLAPALARRQAMELSVGQQQRVAAARALIGCPELLIADEPTSALDSDSQHAFLELLSEESRRARSALLFVSHDRSLASRFDRCLELQPLARSVKGSSS
jgi:putative ABC transport system ATP-binding protein